MWVFVERYGVPSALSRVTAAALSSHASCRQLLRELPEGEFGSAKTTDPEICSVIYLLDREVGRLEAYWYLVLRCSSVKRWRRASARCRRLRRLMAPLTDLPSRGAGLVARDADRSCHPKRARAARRAALTIEETLGGQRIDKRKSEVATLLRRDADAWRSLLDRCPGLEDTSIETSLLRGLLRQRDLSSASLGVEPPEVPLRVTRRCRQEKSVRRQQKRVQRLIWQLELIGASGTHGLGPLLSDLRRFRERLVEQHAVAAFASRLDKLPLREADQRRLERAVGETLAQLHGNSWRLRGWRRDRLAAALGSELRRWAWRVYLED